MCGIRTWSSNPQPSFPLVLCESRGSGGGPRNSQLAARWEKMYARDAAEYNIQQSPPILLKPREMALFDPCFCRGELQECHKWRHEGRLELPEGNGNLKNYCSAVELWASSCSNTRYTPQSRCHDMAGHILLFMYYYMPSCRRCIGLRAPRKWQPSLTQQLVAGSNRSWTYSRTSTDRLLRSQNTFGLGRVLPRFRRPQSSRVHIKYT